MADKSDWPDLPLEVVEWEDHASWTRWGDRESRVRQIQDEPCVCRTVGWLIWEDRRRLALASQQTHHDDVDHVQVILKSCVLSRYEITFTRSRKR